MLSVLLKTEAKARGLTITWRCTGSHKCGVIHILPEKLAAVIEALQQAPTLASVSKMLSKHGWWHISCICFCCTVSLLQMILAAGNCDIVITSKVE